MTDASPDDSDDDAGPTRAATDGDERGSGATDGAFDVPENAAAETCPECGRPVPDAGLLALHRGLEHGASLDEDEREALAEAREAERRELRLFRLRALAVLVVLYFGLLLVYAFVT